MAKNEKAKEKEVETFATTEKLGLTEKSNGMAPVEVENEESETVRFEKDGEEFEVSEKLYNLFYSQHKLAK